MCTLVSSFTDLSFWWHSWNQTTFVSSLFSDKCKMKTQVLTLQITAFACLKSSPPKPLPLIQQLREQVHIRCKPVSPQRRKLRDIPRITTVTQVVHCSCHIRHWLTFDPLHFFLKWQQEGATIMTRHHKCEEFLLSMLWSEIHLRRHLQWKLQAIKPRDARFLSHCTSLQKTANIVL